MRGLLGTCLKVLAALSLIVILSGLVLPDLLQYALQEGIRSAIIWRPDSPPEVDARYRGSDSPSGVPDIIQVWLFNITNVEEIRQGHKPRLEQVGPYVYRKYKIKVASWWDREGRVACKEYDYHVPLPELTRADPNATIVTLNMPLIGVVESIHAAFGPFYERLLDLLVAEIVKWRDGHVDGLFIKRAAAELMWGYDDLLLQRLSGLLPRGMIKSTRVALMTNMTGPEEALAKKPVVYDTGRYDLDDIWNVLSFEGNTEVRSWNNCSVPIYGSDGTQFRPGVTPDESLAVWVAPLFRTEHFVLLENITWQGVDFLRFWPDPAGLEPNECLFQSIRGLMNITSPMAVGINGSAWDSTGPPLYVSQPHFCLADPALSEAVEGLSCDMSNHLTTIDVEPITGIPMRGHLTMMVSSEITFAARTHLEPAIAKTNNRSIVTPIFWTQEDIHALDKDLEDFKSKVYRALRYKALMRGWLPPVGGAVLAASLLLLLAMTVVRCFGGGSSGGAAGARARRRGRQDPGGPGIGTGDAWAEQAELGGAAQSEGGAPALAVRLLPPSEPDRTSTS